MTPEFEHVSVLLQESMEFLAPRAGGIYADATLGGGGHTEAILERSAPDGRVIGLDRDLVALSAAKKRLARFGSRCHFVHSAYEELADVLKQQGVDLLDGFIADLGVSSPQLDHAERGFSFGSDGPLDMRMNQSSGQTARMLIESLTTEELADVIYEYGEERRSRAIARSIKRRLEVGNLETTLDLRKAIIHVTGPKKGKTDPATRTFQALRIAVNRELEQLEHLMSVIPDLVKDDGIIVIISFHSLEDRIVKHSIRNDSRLKRLTKKPVVPSEAELDVNRRARPSKLRAARRVAREEAA